jgi:hypothetical protein
MEDGRMTIKIAFAQRTFELKIQKEWETYYREAEKIINAGILKIAKQWAFKDDQDILSKLLIEEVVKNIECNERIQEYDEELIPKMLELNRIAEQIPID